MTALCRIFLTIVPALWAGTALADAAFLSLDVGGERIDAQAGDVAGHARDADGALFIRLRSSFDAPIARLTGRHTGAVATLTLCGEVLV